MTTPLKVRNCLQARWRPGMHSRLARTFCHEHTGMVSIFQVSRKQRSDQWFIACAPPMLASHSASTLSKSLLYIIKINPKRYVGRYRRVHGPRDRGHPHPRRSRSGPALTPYSSSGRRVHTSCVGPTPATHARARLAQLPKNSSLRRRAPPGCASFDVRSWRRENNGRERFDWTVLIGD
jgi:hypothetical protein